jgi:hypothetical protein
MKQSTFLKGLLSDELRIVFAISSALLLSLGVYAAYTVSKSNVSDLEDYSKKIEQADHIVEGLLGRDCYHSKSLASSDDRDVIALMDTAVKKRISILSHDILYLCKDNERISSNVVILDRYVESDILNQEKGFSPSTLISNMSVQMDTKPSVLEQNKALLTKNFR